MFNLFSPLEQFNVITLGSLYIFCPYNRLKLTIICFILFCFLLLFIIFILFLFKNNNTIKVVSKTLFFNFELLFDFIYKLTYDILSEKNIKYFPITFSIFILIFYTNLLGLIPYSFTLTSHLIITIFLSLTIFLSMMFIGFKKFKFKFFSFFLPGGTSFLLSFLIVPIELISFFFRPISLAVRLFANMMAGHTLLKVIISFAWQLVLIGNILYLFPASLLVILLFLEFSVACIQAYVFTILTILYLNDALNLH